MISSNTSHTPLYERPDILTSAARHQPDALAALREDALELLRTQGLPVTGSEDYKRFDITKYIEGGHTMTFLEPIDPTEFGEFRNHCSLGLHAKRQALMVEEHILCDNHEDGVFFGSLKDFSALYPGVAEQYLGTMDSVRKDSLSALNTLLTQDVAVLYISKGTVLEDTLHMVSLSGLHEGSDRWASPRLLIIAEEDSEARMLSCDHSIHPTSYMSNTVVEIYAGKNSHFELYDIEESSDASIRIANFHVSLEENSHVSLNSLTTQNGSTRNNFYGDLKGMYSELYLNGICILDGDQRADNYSLIRHSAPDCHSDEIFKYTLNDNTVGSFSGKIYVALDAQQTTAYQNNRNLLLSPKAKMYSKPHLEIYADDVKCSHGMTTGELDENALFYMQQRGIPYVEAKLLLTIAFMSEVLQKIQVEPLRDRLIQVVENRYRGLPGYCRRGQE